LKFFQIFLLLCLVVTLTASAFPRGRDENLPAHLAIHLQKWEARIQPQTVSVYALLAGRQPIQIARGFEKPFSVTGLETSPARARWKIPALGLSIEMEAAGDHLHVSFRASHQTDLTWPSSGRDPAMSALIYPDGEGLYIPLHDPFWLKETGRGICRNTHGGLLMPFWSYQIPDATITYLALSDLQTKVCLSNEGGEISTYAMHDFRKRDGLPPYEIEIWPGGASPVSPAIDYRQWLIAHGRYVTLQQKIAANPNVQKLLGAVHAYIFGTGRTPAFLRELRRLGVDRMWLGYGQDPRHDKYLVNREYIAEAEKLGYLIGPYDTFENAQNPKTADDVASIWGNELYPKGCIIDAQGKILKGFHGRGCQLSSEALALAEPIEHNMANRVSRYAQTGINSYFLDSDAFGEFYDDYSKVHPMTPAVDRANFLARLGYISGTRRLVLGSEAGASWSAPVIDFAHGAEAVRTDLLWPLERNRKVFGGWWPPARPGVFFKPVKVSETFAKACFDPVYRLPLYQAALHDSVIAADRWETPLTKFPQLVRQRMLLELLYDVPSMWSLDLKELQENRQTVSKLYKFFSPIHRAAGDLPLTGFEWLTANREVQRTVFGGRIQMTANFGRKAFGSIPTMCVQAQWLNQDKTELFCP
jgi:Glycosyl hydrolases related to GH101 family, GH129